MATVTPRSGMRSSTNGANLAYTTGSFTPTAGDLLVVFASANGAAPAAGAMTASANGMTFTRVGSTGAVNLSLGPYIVDVFISDQLVPSSPSAMTVTYTSVSTFTTGAWVVANSVSGMTRTGVTALLQAATASSASAAAPALTFGSSALTGNPTMYGFVSPDRFVAQTAATGWTEDYEDDIGAPSQKAYQAHRNSGFTGTTITHGTSNTGFAAIAIELDTSAPSSADMTLGGDAPQPTASMSVDLSPVITLDGVAPQPTASMDMVAAAIEITLAGAAPRPTASFTLPAASGGDATFTASAGDAPAAGASASFTGAATFTASVGDAPSAGASATLTGAATFAASAGDAPAAGAAASFTASATFTTSAGDASSDGAAASFTGAASFAANAGDATGDGGTASLIGAATGTFTALVGDAAASGSTASFTLPAPETVTPARILAATARTTALTSVARIPAINAQARTVHIAANAR